MLKSTENKIQKFVPQNIRRTKTSPAIVKAYMTDVHTEFDTILREYSLKNILKSFRSRGHAAESAPDDANADGSASPKVALSKGFYKLLGRTENFETFLKRRRKIERCLLIPYPFIRYIYHFSATDFPDILNDYGRYKCNDKGEPISFTIGDFAKIAKKDLEENQVFLKKIWYPKVVKLLRKYYKRNVIPKNMWPKALKCAIGIMNRQINELKIRTFNHVYEIIGDRIRIPYFKIKILYSENNVELYPSFMDIYKVFSAIFDQIAMVGQQLEILEPKIDAQAFPPQSNLYIGVAIGDVYMREAKEILMQRLQLAYSPILSYLEAFQEKYCGLYNSETNAELEAYLCEPHAFDDYLAKINEFDRHIDNLARSVANEYFDIVTISQSEVVKDLRKIAEGYRCRLTDEVLLAHRKESLSIRCMFQGIKNRAVEVPTSTEMLLANGEYMLDIKTKQMVHIQERIQKSLKVCNNLYIDIIGSK